MLNMHTAPKDLTSTQLAEEIERACDEANRQYVAKLDTTEIDAYVDALFVEHDNR